MILAVYLFLFHMTIPSPGDTGRGQVPHGCRQQPPTRVGVRSPGWQVGFRFTYLNVHFIDRYFNNKYECITLELIEKIYNYVYFIDISTINTQV